MKTNTIEGDTITVEYTQAKVVRGRQIVVGPGSKIDRVEYTVSCEAEEGTVREKVKV